ncbi:CLUMA_CG012640, isoform A [Clunio marinus]|uniref:CLUMA_CG012640, isoform A n=1 Tax=Clunio marinus TaxID=568069 RepID=A0A1J1IJL5_9DIPT|nr:CLUMA_CG012640, isoform A [Clunio marinus]
MSYNSTSPTNYGFEGDPLLEAYMNAKFSEEISEKMKVPKRITANGVELENNEILNGNQMNSWNYHEKIDMTVPDRIVVIGQDQHLVISGTKSAPREIMLENSILPKDPGMIRVSTPPRVITLSEHHFPSASDELEDDEDSRYFEPKNLDFNEDSKKGMKNNRKINQNSHEMIHHREETPQFGSGIGSIENLSTSHDEALHLRKQVAKLNRRLLNVEIDNLQRTQREKILYALGVAYFVLKAIYWFNRK